MMELLQKIFLHRERQLQQLIQMRDGIMDHLCALVSVQIVMDFRQIKFGEVKMFF
jgi:hypothetical protein